MGLVLHLNAALLGNRQMFRFNITQVLAASCLRNINENIINNRNSFGLPKNVCDAYMVTKVDDNSKEGSTL